MDNTKTLDRVNEILSKMSQANLTDINHIDSLDELKEVKNIAKEIVKDIEPMMLIHPYVDNKDLWKNDIYETIKKEIIDYASENKKLSFSAVVGEYGYTISNYGSKYDEAVKRKSEINEILSNVHGSLVKDLKEPTGKEFYIDIKKIESESYMIKDDNEEFYLDDFWGDTPPTFNGDYNLPQISRLERFDDEKFQSLLNELVPNDSSYIKDFNSSSVRGICRNMSSLNKCEIVADYINKTGIKLNDIIKSKISLFEMKMSENENIKKEISNKLDNPNYDSIKNSAVTNSKNTLKTFDILENIEGNASVEIRNSKKVEEAIISDDIYINNSFEKSRRDSLDGYNEYSTDSDFIKISKVDDKYILTVGTDFALTPSYKDYYKDTVNSHMYASIYDNASNNTFAKTKADKSFEKFNNDIEKFCIKNNIEFTKEIKERIEKAYQSKDYNAEIKLSNDHATAKIGFDCYNFKVGCTSKSTSLVNLEDNIIEYLSESGYINKYEGVITKVSEAVNEVKNSNLADYEKYTLDLGLNENNPSIEKQRYFSFVADCIEAKEPIRLEFNNIKEAKDYFNVIAPKLNLNKAMIKYEFSSEAKNQLAQIKDNFSELPLFKNLSDTGIDIRSYLDTRTTTYTQIAEENFNSEYKEHIMDLAIKDALLYSKSRNSYNYSEAPNKSLTTEEFDNDDMVYAYTKALLDVVTDKNNRGIPLSKTIWNEIGYESLLDRIETEFINGNINLKDALYVQKTGEITEGVLQLDSLIKDVENNLINYASDKIVKMIAVASDEHFELNSAKEYAEKYISENGVDVCEPNEIKGFINTLKINDGHYHACESSIEMVTDYIEKYSPLTHERLNIVQDYIEERGFLREDVYPLGKRFQTPVGLFEFNSSNKFTIDINGKVDSIYDFADGVAEQLYNAVTAEQIVEAVKNGTLDKYTLTDWYDSKCNIDDMTTDKEFFKTFIEEKQAENKQSTTANKKRIDVEHD